MSSKQTGSWVTHSLPRSHDQSVVIGSQLVRSFVRAFVRSFVRSFVAHRRCCSQRTEPNAWSPIADRRSATIVAVAVAVAVVVIVATLRCIGSLSSASNDNGVMSWWCYDMLS